MAQRGGASDATALTLAVYAAQALTFVTGLVQKGLLGPVGAGYWSLMQSFWELAKVAPLGAFHGTTRQIPLHRGRADYTAAAGAANVGSSFSLMAVGCLGACVAASALAFGAAWAPELRYGLVLLGLSAPLRLLGDIHETISMATSHFRAVSTARIVSAAGGLTLQTAFVALFGFYGMFAGVVLTTVIVLGVYGRMGLTGRRRPIFHWTLSRARLGELIAYGFPLLVFGQIWLLFMVIDNLIVAGFIDVRNLGYYALAVSVTNYLLFLPKSIGEALFPRMTERFGATGDIRAISSYATDVQRALGYMFVPMLIAAAFFLLPVLIRHVLPEFEPAISVIHIMVAGSFFISLCHLPIKTLITAGRRLPLILLVLPCLAFNAGANYVAVAVLDEGIKGAAAATALSYLGVFLATSGYGLSILIGVRRTVGHIGVLITVFAYMALVLWGIETLLGGSPAAFAADAALGIGKLAIFFVAMTPWFVVAQAQVRGPERLWAMVRDGVAAVRSR